MSGNTSGAIVQKCSSEWGVTERQVFKYLKTAREKLKQLMETDYPTIIEEAVAIYDQIIQKALIEGEEKYTADGLRYVTHDLHAAKAALTDKMKLLGHFTNKVKVIKGISDEDREAFGSWETQELEQYVN